MYGQSCRLTQSHPADQALTDSCAQQQQRAQGLNLVVAAIILWNTLELARAIEELRGEGVEMTAEQLRHLSPMDWEHIGLTGDYTWNLTTKNIRA